MNSYYDPYPCCGFSGAQLRQVPQLMGPSTGAPMMVPSFPGSMAAPQMPAMPTGIPTGPSMGPTPVTTLEGTQFIPGFLKTQIGKRVRVEFLIGTNGPLVDRTGTLLGVGTSYILIRPTETDDIELCDLYAIKFVTIYY